jgi:hypothetical protein
MSSLLRFCSIAMTCVVLAACGKSSSGSNAPTVTPFGGKPVANNNVSCYVSSSLESKTSTARFACIEVQNPTSDMKNKFHDVCNQLSNGAVGTISDAGCQQENFVASCNQTSQDPLSNNSVTVKTRYYNITRSEAQDECLSAHGDLSYVY